MAECRLGIVVLAAGEGTRMRSALPKVLHPLCGRPLLGHVLDAAEPVAAVETVVVLASDTIEAVRASFGAHYTYVVQQERLGTGHAVLQARTVLQHQTDDVLVLYGDTPLLRSGTIQQLIELRRTRRALVSLMSFHAHPPTGYGRIIRDSAGHVVDLVEERDATDAQRAIPEGNSGIMCFDADWLWLALDRIPRSPIKGEYYLTELIGLAVAERGPGAVVALVAEDDREAWGVNDRVQLAQAETALRERILNLLMNAGVSVSDPASTYVEAGVTVGKDTSLLPGTLLRGSTSVGSGCEIGPHTLIIDSTIGDRAKVQFAVIERTTISADSVVGPFAHVIEG